MFDLTDHKSFEACRDWLKDIKLHASESIVIHAAGTNCDLESRRAVSKEEIEDLLSPSIPFIEVSARTGQNVDKLFYSAAEMFLATNTEMPKRRINSNENEEIDKTVVKPKPTKEKDKDCIIC